jgi:cyanate lyase
MASVKNRRNPAQSINDVFSIVKEKKGCNSVSELIAELGLSESYFYKIKRGEQFLSTDKALKIAAKAGLSQESMLVLLAREKAHSDEERAVWNKIIERECRIMDIK